MDSNKSPSENLPTMQALPRVLQETRGVWTTRLEEVIEMIFNDKKILKRLEELERFSNDTSNELAHHIAQFHRVEEMVNMLEKKVFPPMQDILISAENNGWDKAVLNVDGSLTIETKTKKEKFCCEDMRHTVKLKRIERTANQMCEKPSYDLVISKGTYVKMWHCPFCGKGLI